MAGKPIRLTDAMRWPEARLALMDEQRVEGTIMFPTLANLVEYHVSDDPELTHDVIHALNQWIDEVWGFALEGRVYSAAAITLALVDRAVTELEWALERGAKVILLRPAPAIGHQGSRAISLPEFDPFWARVQESGIAVCLHSTEAVTHRYADWWEPQESENAFTGSGYREFVTGHRDIEDTLAGFLFHGTLHRFPGLRVASVENGADWVPEFMRRIARAARRNPKNFAEDPVEMFRRSVFVNPFWEEDIPQLLQLCGADRVVYGSDYPHPEGLAEPRAYFSYLEGLDETTIRKIVHDNARELLAV
jgi:predicted TIM-barrel fold metal-dependent hydrolase